MYKRQVIIFGNETADGNKFYLVYDKASGVLLEGYSKYMGYELEIKIKNTDVKLGVSEWFIPTIGGAAVVIIIIIAIVIKKKSIK